MIPREAAYWRDLLKRIAVDLERAARAEADPARQRRLASRATRVGKRLNRGVRDDWTHDQGSMEVRPHEHPPQAPPLLDRSDHAGLRTASPTAYGFIYPARLCCVTRPTNSS